MILTNFKFLLGLSTANLGRKFRKRSEDGKVDLNDLHRDNPQVCSIFHPRWSWGSFRLRTSFKAGYPGYQIYDSNATNLFEVLLFSADSRFHQWVNCFTLIFNISSKVIVEDFLYLRRIAETEKMEISIPPSELSHGGSDERQRATWVPGWNFWPSRTLTALFNKSRESGVYIRRHNLKIFKK